MPKNISKGRKVFRKERRVEQIIGREGETATLYERRPLKLKLRVFGFAPRQFNRSAFRGEIQGVKI